MNYLIVYSRRSRSSVLARHLSELGIGKPDEYFDTQRFSIGNIRELEKYRVGGFLGIRLVWSHIASMQSRLGMGLKAFSEALPGKTRFIHVRRDPIQQALECCKDKGYAFSEYKQIVADILKEHAGFDLFFEQHGIVPLEVDAKQLRLNPKRVMRDVCVFLGLWTECSYFSDVFADALVDDPDVQAYYENLLFKYREGGYASHND